MQGRVWEFETKEQVVLRKSDILRHICTMRLKVEGSSSSHHKE
jgi:hypothetical protein